MRQLLPGAWTFAERPSGACLADYARLGWTSYVPGSCRGATVALTPGDRWTLWGWPYRFLDRMAAAEAECGDFTEAIRLTKKALELCGPEHPHRARLKLQLKLFEEERPFRDEPGALGNW